MPADKLSQLESGGGDLFGTLNAGTGDGKRVLAVAYPMRARAVASENTPAVDLDLLQLRLNRDLGVPDDTDNLQVRAYTLDFAGAVLDTSSTPAEMQLEYEQALQALLPGGGDAWFSVDVTPDADPARAHELRHVRISVYLQH